MDDANEPPRTVTNARRMAEQTKVFAFVGSVGTPQNQAIKAYTAQNKIPNIFIYSGIYEWGDEKQNPWGIGMVPSFTTEAAIYAKYLQEHKPDAKVAMLYLNTDFGTQLPRRLQGRHQGQQDPARRRAVERQHRSDRRHPADQPEGVGRRHADRRDRRQGRRAGDPLRRRIRLEADRVRHLCGVLGHLAQGRGPREFQGRAHRPVRQAGRLARRSTTIPA